MTKKYQVSISVKTKAEVFKVKGYEGVRVFDEENKVFYFWDKLKNKFVSEVANNINDIALIQPVDESGAPINPYPGDYATVTVDNGIGQNEGPLYYYVQRIEDEFHLADGNQYFLTVDNSTGEPDRPLSFEVDGFEVVIHLATNSEGELDESINQLSTVAALSEGTNFSIQQNGTGDDVVQAGLERTQFTGGGDNVVEGTPGYPGKMLWSTVDSKIYIYLDKWVYFEFTPV